MKNSQNIENYSIELKECLSAILHSSLSLTQENFLLGSAHAFATNLLRIKFSRTPGIKRHLGLNESDLGYDCIAELFERDTKNQLLHFKTYFSNFDFDSLSHQEVLSHFRRLVSSAVNQNLMSVYRDFDPSLGKIIRNLKLSIAAHKAFVEIDRFDETCIAPVDSELGEHLPAADQSVLFDLLSPVVRGDEFVPELLSLFSRAIRSQTEYSKIVPLLTIALVFRALLVQKQNRNGESSDHAGGTFEIEELIKKNIATVKTSILSHNHHGKTSVELIETYFTTIHKLLLARMNLYENFPDSLFEGLKIHIADLNTGNYKKHHRTKLEYYYRLCREAIASELVERKSPISPKKGVDAESSGGNIP